MKKYRTAAGRKGVSAPSARRDGLSTRNQEKPMRPATLLLLAALCSPFCAGAATSALKPGQWNLTVSMKMANMPQLSADQLAQMKQLGIDLPVLSGKPTLIAQCISPEQATLKQPINPQQKPDDQCSIENYRHSGNQVSGDMVCNGEMKAKGHFSMTVTDATHYRGKWTLQGVTRDGQPIDQSSDVSAVWVKDKCDGNAVR